MRVGGFGLLIGAVVSGFSEFGGLVIESALVQPAIEPASQPVTAHYEKYDQTVKGNR